jgi:hypothetical protein
MHRLWRTRNHRASAMRWDGMSDAPDAGFRPSHAEQGHQLSTGAITGAWVVRAGWRGLCPPDLSRGVGDDEGGHNESAPQVSSHHFGVGAQGKVV